MTRVLSSACVLLLLLGLGGRAWAGKPPIAILGLEVYDNGGGIDPETTRAAKELTAALRDRAKAGTGPFTPVQGEKELIDEKLLNNCDSEAATCMAAIGNGLGAELLMYGKIEKATQGGQPVYRVSIKLLSVPRKQLTASTVETLPVADATGVRAQTYAKTWYAKLAGAGSGGTLVVRANIDRGTVLVDDDLKGTLASGTITLTSVAEGRHTLAIEASTRDYQRYEAQVTIRAGETTTQSVTMVPMPRKLADMQPQGTIAREGTVTQPPPKGNIWKPVFYGTAVGAAAAGGFTLFEYLEERHNAGKINPNGTFNSMFGGSSKQVDQGKCDSTDVKNFADAHPTGMDADDVKAFNAACSNFKYVKIGWVVTGVLGAATIGSFIMAYLRDSSPQTEKVTDRGHRKHRQLVVTPIATPQGGGATLRFDW
jgi:PEGA domain-containing protein